MPEEERSFGKARVNSGFSDSCLGAKGPRREGSGRTQVVRIRKQRPSRKARRGTRELIIPEGFMQLGVAVRRVTVKVSEESLRQP